MRDYFAQVWRGSFDIGLSTGKLNKAMTEVLLITPSRCTLTESSREVSLPVHLIQGQRRHFDAHRMDCDRPFHTE